MRWPWGRRAPDVLKDGQQSPRGVERPAPYTALPQPPPPYTSGGTGPATYGAMEAAIRDALRVPAQPRWVSPEDVWGLFAQQAPRPMADQTRFRITQVGTIRVEGNNLVATGWTFWGNNPWVPPGRYNTTTMQDGKVAGWHVKELHAVAHGEPCDCPVTQALETMWPTP